jgi:hypothetical protein
MPSCGSSSAVEHQLPKLRVGGSNPLSRSIFKKFALGRLTQGLLFMLGLDDLASNENAGTDQIEKYHDKVFR